MYLIIQKLRYQSFGNVKELNASGNCGLNNFGFQNCINLLK